MDSLCWSQILRLLNIGITGENRRAWNYRCCCFSRILVSYLDCPWSWYAVQAGLSFSSASWVAAVTSLSHHNQLPLRLPHSFSFSCFPPPSHSPSTCSVCGHMHMCMQVWMHMHTWLCAYAVVWRPEVNFGHLLLLPTSSSNQGCSPNLELADSLSRVASEPLGICRWRAHLVVPTSNPAGVTCFCAKLGCWDLTGELHVCAGRYSTYWVTSLAPSNPKTVSRYILWPIRWLLLHAHPRISNIGMSK